MRGHAALGGSGVGERCWVGALASPWSHEGWVLPCLHRHASCPVPSFVAGLGSSSSYSLPQGVQNPDHLLPSPWCSAPDLTGSQGHPLSLPPRFPHQVVSHPTSSRNSLSILSLLDIRLPPQISPLPTLTPSHSSSFPASTASPPSTPLPWVTSPLGFTSPLSLPEAGMREEHFGAL